MKYLVRVVSNDTRTYYCNNKHINDPEFMDAEVVFENHKWFGWGWNLYVRKCIDNRGLLTWDLISNSHHKTNKEGGYKNLTMYEIYEFRQEVEHEALRFMSTRRIKTDWCRGEPPNF